MKSDLLKIGIALFAALTSFACSDPNDKPEPPAPPVGTIKFNNYLMSVDGRESVRPFNLSATTPWKVELTDEQRQWIEVIPESGEGSYKATKIMVKTKENSISKLSREASLKFSLVGSSDESGSAILKVSQGSEYFMKIDSLAVLAFYHATDGPNWTKPWDITGPIENWHFRGQGGITADKNYVNGVFIIKDAAGSRRINRLAWFEPMNMKGKLPVEMKNLTAMGMFELAGFELEGQTFGEFIDIVTSWPDLRNLWLTKGCKMGGAKIPTKLATLELFHHFNFQDHDFIGFEDDFGSIEFKTLFSVSISDGPLTGELKPEYFDKMPKLGIISVPNNDLIGTVSGKLIIGKPELKLMEIYGNRFVGDFPSNIRNSPVWTYMESPDDPASNSFCPQQTGFGFTPGTCQ